MKRLLVVLLIMCMAVSVCACGKKEEKLYKVGESASTDRAVVTVKSLEFRESNRAKEEGRVYVDFKLDIKNIGNTDLDDHVCKEDGTPYSNYLSAYILLEYDEYMYRAYGNSDHWIKNETTRDEYFNIPKGETHSFSGGFSIPIEAMTNDKQVLLYVQVPNSKGKFEMFKFKLK